MVSRSLDISSQTVNKSQGQTFDYIGVDLTQELFGHGHSMLHYPESAASIAQSWSQNICSLQLL